VRRIDCGGGEGGEPALSPPGWKSYASRMLQRPRWGMTRGYVDDHKADILISAYPTDGYASVPPSACRRVANVNSEQNNTFVLSCLWAPIAQRA